MGLFDKIFGFSLVAAGVFIAIYWTMWIFMILVSATLTHTHNDDLLSPSSPASARR